MKHLPSLLLTSCVVWGTACGGDVGNSEPTDTNPTQPGVGPGVTSPSGSNSVDDDDPTGTSPGTTAPPVTPVTPTPTTPTGKAPIISKCSESAVGAPTLRALTRVEFQNSINDIFPGIAGKWNNSLPSNTVSAAGFDNDASALIGPQTAEQLLYTAEAIGTAVSESLPALLPCASAADHACAAQFVETYGERIFRRPLTNPEKEQYLAFFDTALAETDFPKAMKWLTAALVQSPKAVYRSELGASNGNGRSLSQHEIATLLAYTFTGTTPSAELLAQADAGQLTDPVAVAKTLLQTDLGKQTLHRFFESYTIYPRAASKTKPDAQGNGISYNQVSTDMVKETRAFLENVLFAQNGSLQDLLTSTTTYPSQQLSNFYGLQTPGSDYSAVERPAGHGIGLMAQGSFLAAHANADASSPTQRGLFAYINLLCRSKPPLPDDVPQLGEVQTGKITTRQRYEEMHAKGDCAGCHKLFDPIGYAFEHFDEAGRYRADEDGLTIDPTGFIKTSTGEQVDFASQEDLANTLADLPEVHQCFNAYLATYAFGTSQSCLATKAVPEMQAGALSVVDAFAALANEPHFTMRKAQ